MKLLYVKASGFKNIQNDCVLDFTAKSKKTTEDKEYELQEIADGLFVYNTVAFIGKNASGKTSVLKLITFVFGMLNNRPINSIDCSEVLDGITDNNTVSFATFFLFLVVFFS